MKIRSGFVSNSSSSSFVALIPKAEWADIMMKNRSIIAQAVAGQLTSNVQFCGMDLIEFSFIEGNHDTFDGSYESLAEDATRLAEEQNTIIPDEDLEEDTFQELVHDARSELQEAIEDLGKRGDRVYITEEEF